MSETTELKKSIIGCCLIVSSYANLFLLNSFGNYYFSYFQKQDKSLNYNTFEDKLASYGF